MPDALEPSMQSIQYPIALPDDYAMERIFQRVRDRAQAFDDYPGLGFKAFLTHSRANGAAHNGYAPFYVWTDPAAIAPFLCGPLFGAVRETFGRPPVITRQVLECAVLDRSAEPTVATFETLPTPASSGLADIGAAEAAWHRSALSRRGLLATCSLVDMQAWTVIRVCFWANDASIAGQAPGAERFDVIRFVGPALKAGPPPS